MKIELKKGADGVYRFEGEVPKDTAEMERGIMSGGIVDKIPSWKPGGIPVGRGLKAMVVAGAGDAAGAALIRYMPGTLFSGQYSVAVLKALTIWLPV